jgi:GNAT superfamily N-acetyltransferase
MPVRAATEADVSALRPLMRGYCDFYHADPPDSGLEEVALALAAEPDDQGILLVATEEEGQVVGFAACGWKWSSLHGARIVGLEDLFVAADARGRGHGASLIEAVADLARRHGAPVVTWLTAPDNLRARSVYDRAGATSEPFLEYELELA